MSLADEADAIQVPNASTSSGSLADQADAIDTSQPSAASRATAAPSGPFLSTLAGNFIPSAGRLVGGIANALAHPIDTAQTLWDFGAGELRNLTPAPIRNAIDVAAPSDASTRASNVASNVNANYANRYGGLSNIKNTVATDPVGALSDAAAIVFPAAKAVGAIGDATKISALNNAEKALSVGGNVINPVTIGGKLVGVPAGAVAKNLLGTTTGVGSEPIAQAYKAGQTSNAAFWNNMTGAVPVTDVLETAKNDLASMKAQKSADYRSGMVGISKDNTVLNFNDVDKALQNASGTTTYKGQIIKPVAAQAVQSASDAVNNWKNLDPAQYHTPEGMDALKQQVGGILESIPYNESSSRLAVGNIYNAIKGTITNQAPAYAKVMQNYSDASDQIDEVTKALSLGQKASADTAMRKLQSLMRNNVNTNYGNRLDLAKQLQQQGGQDILPAIAGQALNSWTPRGLVGGAGVLGNIGEAVLNKNIWGLPLLPLQSPKAVGLGAYGFGKLSKSVNPTYANYLSQIGKVPQGASQ